MYGAVIVGDGLLVALEGVVGVAAVEVGQGILWVELDGPVVVGDGLLVALEGVGSVAAVEVGLSVSGLSWMALS